MKSKKYKKNMKKNNNKKNFWEENGKRMTF